MIAQIPWMLGGVDDGNAVVGCVARRYTPHMGDRDTHDPGASQELAALAERFFDLWQDQLAAWASDPQLVAGWERLWASWFMQTGGVPPGNDGVGPTQPRPRDKSGRGKGE